MRWTIDLVNPNTGERRQTLCRFWYEDQALRYAQRHAEAAAQVAGPGFVPVVRYRTFNRKTKTNQ